MKSNTIQAEIRTEKGKNETFRLRDQGYIPAVIYSHGKSEEIKIRKKDFYKLFKGAISESILIDLNIIDKQADNQHTVFVKDYQKDPITDDLMHLDFYKITVGEKISTRVSVDIIGSAKGEKLGGILEIIERELMVECLPRELPEKIKIDVTNLDIGNTIHIKDIETSGSLKFLGESDRVVVAVISPHKAKVEEEEVAVIEGEESGEKESKAAEEK